MHEMKHAFCSRCDRDLALMIHDDEPMPTCRQCLNRALDLDVVVSDTMLSFSTFGLVIVIICFVFGGGKFGCS